MATPGGYVGSATEQLERISPPPERLTRVPARVRSRSRHPFGAQVTRVSLRTEMLLLLLPAVLLGVLATFSR